MTLHDELQTTAPGNVVVRDGQVHLIEGGPTRFKVEGARVGGKSTFTLEPGKPLEIKFKDGEKAVITLAD